MKLRTFVLIVIAIVAFSTSTTITACQFYWSSTIEDLQSEIDTKKIEQNQSEMKHKLDSTGNARNMQLENLQRQVEELSRQLKQQGDR